MKDTLLTWLWAWIWPLVWLALSLVTVMKIMEVFYLRPKRIEKHFSRQGIKGPSYRFFIGNMKEMVTLIFEASSKPMLPCNSHNILPRVLSFYHHWKKIFGSTFVLWFGPVARLTVADPDLIREIFVSRSEYFERYEAHPLVRQLEGEGLVSLRGQKWAHHRKVINPTFHMDNLKLLMPLIGKRMVEMVENWSSKSSSSGEFEIDVYDWFHSLTEDTISQTVFGRSYEDGKAVFQLQAQQMLFAAEAFYKVLIPGYRYLPTKKNTISWRLEKEIRSKLVRLISKRKDDHEDEEKTAGEDGRAKDLLGLMIDESRKLRRNNMIISVHDIMEECKTFFFAGKQTTSSLLTWATVLLAMHQDWQENARHEVLSVCGPCDIPTRDHLSKLKTLGMVLYETLRLYPPAVATIRTARADVDLGGYHIPHGTELLIPIIAVHHDTALWGPDAAEFNPARFSEGVARAAKHPAAFIPFGLGARTCIGQNLALMEAKLTVAILLQRFWFRLAPSYVHAPTVLMLLYPRY
ncbi:Cytochrome P450 B-class protein, partial [Dioscorea alata]